jgi:hypothetical protein
MTTKSLLLTGALALASLTIANAKTYELIFSGPTQAGNVQMTAGEYKLKLDGSNAIFTNLETSKSYTIPVKVGHTQKKYDVTQTETTKAGSVESIKAIDLAGSDTQLQFSE